MFGNPHIAAQIEALMNFAGLDQRVVLSGVSESLSQLFRKFLEAKGGDFTIHHTTWKPMFAYLISDMKKDFEDHDDLVAPSIVTNFKEWVESTIGNNTASASDSKGTEAAGDDDEW